MKVLLLALYDLYSYGIRGLHATLKKEGFDVKSLFFKGNFLDDEAYTEEQVDELVKYIVNANPDILGIGLRSPLLPLFKEIISKIKPHSNAKILIGGHHGTADPESLKPYADYIHRGEVGNAIGEICFNLGNSGNTNFYMQPSPVKDLDALEFDYYGSDDEYFFTDPPYDTNRLSLYAMKGCFFRCSFCFEQVLKNLYKERYKVRRKSVRRVIMEIRRYQKMFPNLKDIVFSDPILTWGDEWIKEFSREFPKTGLRFRCFGHVSLANRDMLDRLTDAGMDSVTFGIQSASPRMSEIYNRGHSKDIGKFLRSLDGLGSTMRFDFIVNVPFEREKDKKMTEDFIKLLPKSSIIRRLELRHFRGTPLTDYCLEKGHITEKDVEGNKFVYGHGVSYWKETKNESLRE